jgi:hypothetical protein
MPLFQGVRLLFLLVSHISKFPGDKQPLAGLHYW